MSDKIYLGSRLADLDIGEPSLPVSKVILNVDSQTYYQSGDDTGLTVEKDCPWATQEMADSVLAKLKGFVYKPYTGMDALLDPSAELGDALTVGGTYSVLAQMGRNLDRQSAATVGAPGTNEIEDEYPYKSRQRKQTDRNLAKVYSRISKTAEEIRLLVEEEVGELGDRYTELKVTVDGVTVTDETGTTLIKGSSIQTDTLYVNAANIRGTLRADQIVLSGSITWDDLDSTVQNNINSAGGISASEARTIINSTLVSSPTIAGGVFSNLAQSTYITIGASSAGNYGLVLNDNTDGNIFSIYNGGNGIAQFSVGNWVFLNVYSNWDTVYPVGSWDFSQAPISGTIDFSGANVVGLTPKFAS